MPFYRGKPFINRKKEAEHQAEMLGIPYSQHQEMPPMAENNFIPKEFDLSKPQVVPYEFQQFPKMVYDHSKAQPARDEMKKNAVGVEELVHIPAVLGEKIVRDQEELDAALAKGFQEQPPVFASEEEEPAEADEEQEPEEEAEEAAPRSRRRK